MSGPHTPGPWHIGEGKAEIIVYAPDGYAVANAEVFHFIPRRRGDSPANARLMAVAPEMLDGLKNAAETFRKYEALHTAKLATALASQGRAEIFDKAEANRRRAEELEAIIAKAEGRL